MTLPAAGPATRSVGSSTTGFVLVGASGFVLLASGPRLLGVDDYSSLAVAWTVATVIGIGLGQPGEQTVIRVVAGGGGTRVARAVRRRLLVVAAVTLLLPLLSWTGHLPWLGGSALWGAAVVVAALGWALLAGPRGRLAAAHDFRGYGLTLAVEAVARVALCGLAWLLPSSTAALLALAVGLPLVVAAGAAAVLRHRDEPEPGTSDGHVREQGQITAVALLSQLAVNTAPLWLAARAVDPATAGAYVTATSYLRIPVLLVGGLLAVSLATMSSASGGGDVERVRTVAWRAVTVAVGTAAVATLGLLLVSGPMLRLLYGGDVDLPRPVLAVVAATTVVAVAAGMSTQLLFGLRRSGVAVAAWALAAVAATVLLWSAHGDLLAVTVAVLAGQLVAVVGLAVPLARAVRRR